MLSKVTIEDFCCTFSQMFYKKMFTFISNILVFYYYFVKNYYVFSNCYVFSTCYRCFVSTRDRLKCTLEGIMDAGCFQYITQHNHVYFRTFWQKTSNIFHIIKENILTVSKDCTYLIFELSLLHNKINQKYNSYIYISIICT